MMRGGGGPGRRRVGPAFVLALVTLAALGAGFYGLTEIQALPNECELVRMFPNYFELPAAPGKGNDGRYRLFYFVEGWALSPEETKPGAEGGGDS